MDDDELSKLLVDLREIIRLPAGFERQVLLRILSRTDVLRLIVATIGQAFHVDWKTEGKPKDRP